MASTSKGVNLMMVFSFSQFPPFQFRIDEMKSPAIKH
jgi:hypothetical protein